LKNSSELRSRIDADADGTTDSGTRTSLKYSLGQEEGRMDWSARARRYLEGLVFCLAELLAFCEPLSLFGTLTPSNGATASTQMGMGVPCSKQYISSLLVQAQPRALAGVALCCTL
jgi:hypothetical protein